MTVETTNITSGPYSGNDIVVEFDYDFLINDISQITVYETDTLGVITELTPTADFTVTGVGDPAGGKVTRVAGALPTGYKWYMRSNHPDTQATAFGSQGGFFPQVHEAAFDKRTIVSQQRRDELDRCISLALSDDSISSTTMLVPPLSERSGLLLGFDSLGNVEVKESESALLSQTETARDAAVAAAASVEVYRLSSLQLLGTFTPPAGDHVIVIDNKNHGGIFKWDTSLVKTLHDGFHTYDPGVMSLLLWPYTSAGAGTGCYVRVDANTINVKHGNAIGDGVTLDTVPLKAAAELSARMFNQVAFPPAGGEFTPPIVEYPPGAYRVDDTIPVYVGTSVTGIAKNPFTVEHTRVIMDTQGGTVNLNKHIFKITRIFQSVARSNFATVNIDGMGFWITNPGSTITARGGTQFPVDPVTKLGTAGTGCHIYCDEDMIDTRIKNCNHYSTPYAAVMCENATNMCSLELSNNEYDTPIGAIFFRNAVIDAKIQNGNLFFNNSRSIVVDNCTGDLTVKGNTLQFNSSIRIEGVSKLSHVTYSNNEDGGCTSGTLFHCESADAATIVGNTNPLAEDSTYYLKDVRDGIIASNNISNSGFNTAISTSAAIELEGCALTVIGNDITTPDAATYNGYGIRSFDSAGNVSRNKITGNTVDASYIEARKISYFETDEVQQTLMLTETVSGNELHKNLTTFGIFTSLQNIVHTVSSTITVPLDGVRSGIVTVHASQVSSNTTHTYEVLVQKGNLGGAITIFNVTRDATVGVGNGPHTLDAGNTVTFSIASNDLVITSAITTDPILFACEFRGQK